MASKASKTSLAKPELKQEFCFARIEVRPSKIHRWGVFALEKIPKGRKVIEYTGEAVSRREGKRRSESTEIHCLFTIDKYWYLDGAVDGSGAEFINHSCEPNLESRNVNRRIYYYSIRDLAPGDELLVDYHFGKDQEKVKCSCGALKCRGYINLLD